MSCRPDGQECATEGEAILDCNASGEWQDGETCEFVCIRDWTQFESNAACGGFCVPDTFDCSGSDVSKCNEGWWRAGGLCNYGCSTDDGCSCTAPEGRLVDLPGNDVLDTVTGLTWKGTWSTSCSQVTADDLRNATYSEVITMMVEQPRSTGGGVLSGSCAENVDPLLSLYEGDLIRFPPGPEYPLGGYIDMDSRQIFTPPQYPPAGRYACILETP